LSVWGQRFSGSEIRETMRRATMFPVTRPPGTPPSCNQAPTCTPRISGSSGGKCYGPNALRWCKRGSECPLGNRPSMPFLAVWA